MYSRRPLAQLPAILPPRIAAIATLIVITSVFGAGDAGAETEKIHVVFAGGVDRLESVAVHHPTDGPAHLKASSPTELTLSEGGLAAYSDVAVLPGGDLLLASRSGQGVVRFDGDGGVSELLVPTSEAVDSAVAAGFVAPDDPDLLVLSHADQGLVRLFDTVDGDDWWTTTLVRDGTWAQIRRAIVLPDGRIAIAALWSPPGISTVTIAFLDDPHQIQRILWSHPHPDADEGDPVIDGLHPIRDLMADLDGRLLVTSAQRISIVDPDGGLYWEWTMAGGPTPGGEFQAARWTDTGLVVAAVHQPGLWNQPHANHRVLLLDPDADAPLLDSSPSLQAAPIALASARGVGATGTRHYYADAFDDGGAHPSTLVISRGPQLDPDAPPLDETAALSCILANDGDEPVALRRVEFHTTPERCDDVDGEAFAAVWWSEDVHQQIDAGDEYAVESEVVADRLSATHHCGRIAVVDGAGDHHFIGPSLDFRIRSPDGKPPVIVEELATHGDGSPRGDPGLSGEELDRGCTCSSTSPSQTVPIASLLLALALAARRL